MKRAIKTHLGDFIGIIVLVLAALFTLLVILYNQKAALPAWVPGLGQDFYELNAEFATAQAVTPGQGQAIDIAGIQIGKVGAVSLEDGVAVVRMDIDTKYERLIHSDATLLLRPKTGLNDMVIEVDPGTSGKNPPEGSTIPLAQTEPNVQPDQILTTLDTDTREYLALLLEGGGRGLGGNGKRFSAVLRRFEPFTRDLARIGRALEVRRTNIRRSIHSFRLIAEELGHHDADLARFVDSTNAALGHFANQQAALQESLVELPPTLRAAQSGLEKSDQLSRVLRPALLALIPSAVDLKPALEATQETFRETTIPIRDQIRPFTRETRPTLTHLVQAAKPLKQTSQSLKPAFTDLNTLFNMLAFNPSGSQDEGYLFWLSWLNHNFNSIFLTQDAEGPLRRGLLIITCNTAIAAIGNADGNALLNTNFQTSQLPTPDSLPDCGGP
jgi:phospholipid/cholesterol/gamma-HCH transport system substrate-binding protein